MLAIAPQFASDGVIGFCVQEQSSADHAQSVPSQTFPDSSPLLPRNRAVDLYLLPIVSIKVSVRPTEIGWEIRGEMSLNSNPFRFCICWLMNGMFLLINGINLLIHNIDRLLITFFG